MRLHKTILTSFFIFLFALQSLSADPPRCDGVPEEMLLNEPSCIVNHSVNIITGNYHENEIDVEVAGPHPLLYQRSYVSGIEYSGELGQWSTNHKGKINVWPGESKRFLSMYVYGDHGSVSDYTGKIPRNEQEATTLAVNTNAFQKYMTNCPDFCFVAGGHTRCNRVVYREKARELFLTTGNGFLRHYQYKSRGGTGERGKYEMDFERHPNGCLLRYSSIEKQRKISLENEQGKELSSLQIGEIKDGIMKVIGSDGKWVRYRFKDLSKSKHDPVYYLSHVDGSNIPSQSYEYSTGSLRKNPKIICKHMPEGRFLSNEYYKKGSNQNGSDRVKLYFLDPKLDRIMLQKSPVGVDSTPITTHRYFYHLRMEGDDDNLIALGGQTTVYDAHDQRTDYLFNDDYRITDICRWGEGNQYIYSFEKSFWGANDTANSTNLMSRTLANAHSEIKLCRSYTYDHNGNALQKIFWGQLTGRHLGNIILDPNGIPYPWSSECHVKTYTYSTDNHNHLLSENDGKKTIEYTYYPNTNQVSRSLTKVGDTICKREFNGYDSNGSLTVAMADDGSELFIPQHSNITERRTTFISNRTEAPIGLPETIEQRYMDLTTGQDILLGKVCNKYSQIGRLLSQEHYDSENTLKFILEWDYDALGNVIMEKDALGRIINRKYDRNKNLIYEEGPFPGFYKEFKYDFSNRLIGLSEVHPDGTRLTSSFRYDFLGNKIASIDPYGQETRFVYDHQNRLIRTLFPIVINENQVPLQPIAQIEYDLFNNPSKIIDVSGGTTTIAYTAYNKPYRKIHPDGTAERFEYDTSGNMTLSVAQNGTKTFYEYDAFDRVIKKYVVSPEDELIHTESNVYNAFHLLSNTGPDGMTTHYEYDNAGRMIKVIKGEMRTEYAYDTLGRESRVLTFFGLEPDEYTAQVKEYDFLNRVIEQRDEDSLGNVLTKEVYEYDLSGNRNVVCKFNQAGESLTKTEYNTRGQPVLMTNALGEQTRIHYRYDYYDPTFGQNLPYSEITDPKGVVIVCIKDALGKIKTEYKKDPFGKLIQKRNFYYTVTGLLSKTVDEVIVDGVCEREFVNVCIYNAVGKLIQTCESAGHPEQKITKFSYNSSGQKESETKPDGVILHYTYDALGRLKEYFSSDKSFHYVYEYDLNNNPLCVLDRIHGTKTLKEFDQYNRLIKEIFANRLTLEYTYDLSGKPTNILFPDGSGMALSYENIFLKEMTRINQQGEKCYVHTYDAYDLSGNVIESTLIGKAGKIGYTVDLKGCLTNVTTDAWSGSILNFDEAGNISKKEFKDGLGTYSSEFNYDALNQLLEETGAVNEQYVCDSLYNRIKKGNTDYTLNHLNQITHDGKIAYEYDLNGNLIKIDNDQKIIKLSYDALNRLVKVEKDDQLILYAYDEMNRRISKTISLFDYDKYILKKSFNYFYQGLNEVGCYEDDKLVELRLLGLGKGAEIGAAVAMEFNNTVYAPIHDLHGNVICLVEADTGKVKEFYRYSAFGEESLYDECGKTSQTAINPWRFSSKRTDSETGFVYFGRRYYDSHLGRWITPDPIGYEGGPNLYAYVMNNPLGNIDLYGLVAEDASGASGSERGFFDGVRDFMRSAYEGVRDGVASVCNTIADGLSRITSTLCDTFSAYCEERQIIFNQKMLQSRMNRNQSSTRTVGTGEYAGIGLTNGINTSEETLMKYGKIISDAVGGCQVVCVHNPSNGLIHDIFRAFHSIHFDLASGVISALHKAWDAHFEKHGNMRFLQLCHSEGGVNVRNALMCYNPELRKMIDVLAVAPAAYIGTSLCGNVYHYVSTRDFVPWFDVRGRMNNRDTTTILPAHTKANFWDHDFSSQTYDRAIKFHIKQQLKNIGK